MAKTTKATDILSFIEAEHRQVEQLFAEAEKANVIKLYECYNKIYEALTLHTRAEELVLYPAMGEYEETKKYIKEAESEHNEAKAILEELKELKPSDSQFQAKIKELKKAVQHHVKEEENEIFNAVRKCMNDEKLNKLGQEFQAAKPKLEAEVQLAMTE